MLDGLPANADVAEVKDVVWDELVKIGLVQNNVGQIEAPAAETSPQGQDEAQESGDVNPRQDGAKAKEQKEEEVLEAEKVEEREDRWEAEDSFA
jgi:hypothetical protein